MAINQTKPGLLNPLAAYNQARQPGGFLAPTENFQGFLTDPRASIGIQIAQGVPLGQAIFSGATQAQQLKELFNKEEDERRIVKGADGFNYYEDGTRVLPDVEQPIDTTNNTTDYQNYLNTDLTPTPEEFKTFLDRNETKTNNIKTVNNQIIDITDQENPNILFDGRDDPNIKTQIVDGQVIITNTFTGVSNAKPISNFVKDVTESQTKKIEFFNKQYTNNAVVKNFNEATVQLDKLLVGSKDPSAAGDLAMIFTYMKILDPTSVVREGEQATAQNAAGTPERIKNIYNRVLTGERLTEDQRKDFTQKGVQLYQGNQLSVDRFKTSYEDSFIGDGILPSSVFTDSDIRPKKIELNGQVIDVPRGTLLIDFDPNTDSYIYQMPNGEQFKVGRTTIQ